MRQNRGVHRRYLASAIEGIDPMPESDAPPSNHRPPPILAIDSASDQAGLALYDGHSVSELSWPAGRTQTATMLAQIHHLIALRGLAARDVGAVAVGLGPGSFTGVRIGISLAKGLALGLDIPIFGIPTLSAAALPFLTAAPVVVSAMSAGRGRLVWAVYAAPHDPAEITPRLLSGPTNGTPSQLRTAAAAVAAPIVGERDGEEDPGLAPNGPPFAGTALRNRRPAAFAILGWHRWQGGDGDNLTALDALYVAR